MKFNAKKTMILAALALAGAAASAQEAAPAAAPAEAAPAPTNTLAYNVGVVTEYRYRGISQTRFQPAVQGGIDFTHTSGLYIGTWASNIKWIKDDGISTGVNVKGPVEWDIYGGYRGEIVTDLSFDVGYLRYQYAGNSLANTKVFANANTDELYGALTYKIYTAKYSRSFSNLFGWQNSSGSGYLDLSANVDLGDGLSLVPHVGHQSVAGNGNIGSYTDYALTLGKDYGNGFSVSAALIGTNAKLAGYASPFNDNLGKSTLVLGAKYTF